ncbi:DJ-1/PfpI family protein [Streptomyces mirabilis]|nr:DJ-1/PfpI family protein [Streptomyces mirabilis]
MNATSAMSATNDHGSPVHLAVYDTYADWETGHTTAYLARAGREIRTVGPTREPVTTIGGLRIQPDLALDELRPEDSSLLILTGADLWDTSDDLTPFARKARAFLDAGVPVAAICGRRPGSPARAPRRPGPHQCRVLYLAATGYRGGGRYADTDAVTDGNLVTAGPTEPVAFAREVLRLLGVYEGEVLDAWYRLFHDSDASAYAVLEKASGAAEEAAR